MKKMILIIIALSALLSNCTLFALTPAVMWAANEAGDRHELGESYVVQLDEEQDTQDAYTLKEGEK